MMVRILASSLLLASFGWCADPWVFDKIRVLSDQQGVNIENEVYNKSGGTVDLLVSGQPFDLCPGGYERIRFVWRIDRDISRLLPGERFGARIEIRKAGVTPPCGGALADRAYAQISGSAGAVANWPDNELRLLDGNRFQTRQLERASVNRVGDSIIELSGMETSPGQPNGWFQVQLTTVGGFLRYCYVFRPAPLPAASPGPPTSSKGADSYASLGGTWYREGDRQRPASIQLRGSELVLVNENGLPSRARLEGSEVVAIDWGSLRGRLVDNGNRIEWGNGSAWSRPNPGAVPPPVSGSNVQGTWYREGDRQRPASIQLRGSGLLLVNENGLPSRARLEGSEVVAIDWSNLRGRLLDNNTRIAWANNTNWSR